MLVLFETPAGYALFKVNDDNKLKDVDNIWKEFETPEAASEMVKLKAFQAFADTTEAVAAATACVENKMGKDLKKFLKKNIVAKELTDKLAVIDSKVGGVIKEKLGIKVVNDSSVMELMRGIRSQLSSLITSVTDEDQRAMTLGLAHSLSRYKLKFSPDKVDTMIVQAIGLLDDLDKEINTYAMRLREWNGWHFPELSEIIGDHRQYACLVARMGTRDNVKSHDYSDILDDTVEARLREIAEVSMGTELSVEDVANIKALCDQVVEMTDYRTELNEYLRNRMAAVAPNLTVMVGELVGARLIAHAGSLINLAKQPASTIQILGAEKALFRALKTKHETPKYGLIYHASLIGQAAPKNKGRISRVLAAKTALAVRVDALGDDVEPTLGLECRAKVEARLRQLEGKSHVDMAKSNGASGTPKKYSKGASEGAAAAAGGASYNAAADMQLETTAAADDSSEETKTPKKAKKDKKEKKKRKAEDEAGEEDEEAAAKSAKKAKKAAKKAAAAAEAEGGEENGEKKKKKKKKSAE